MGKLEKKTKEDSKGNQKLFFRVFRTSQKEKAVNAKQIKKDLLREEKEIMDRWKEYCEELVNVQPVYHIRY